MTSDELKQSGERLYGPHWRVPLAWALQVNIATLRRWTSGEIVVPGPVALAVSLLVERASTTPPTPPAPPLTG